MGYGFKIVAEGDYACFTRAEMAVERVSYDVPTPGALEGMLKSIYWKPAIRYVIDKIVVFNPIAFTNIRRNEVKDKVSFGNVKNRMKGGGAEIEIYASQSRNQRASMVLKNVRYGIEFHFEMTGIRSENPDDDPDKHYNIILRRLRNGQYFKTPVFGCREFSVGKIELVDDFPMEEVSEALRGDVDLGFMLYKMNFRDGGLPENGDWERKKFSDAADASFYRPHMIDGVIDVARYREELKC